MGFFESHFLWLDVVIAAAISGAAAAVAGIHAILRRVVFLPAALSQLAGLGVVTAFWVAHHLYHAHETGGEYPRLFAVVCAAVGAVLLGLMREGRGATREWALGAVYIGSSALIILAGGAIPQELHDVNDILFGNAIAIERGQMISTVLIACAVLLLNGLLARQLVALGFDPETARAHGVPVRLLDGLLFVSMGLAVATSTRVVGALPAFAFAVFPGAAALLVVRDARALTAVAGVIGAAAAFLGYWASFSLSLPTGASMAAMSGVLYLVIWLGRAVRKRYPAQAQKRS